MTTDKLPALPIFIEIKWIFIYSEIRILLVELMKFGRLNWKGGQLLIVTCKGNKIS